MTRPQLLVAGVAVFNTVSAGLGAIGLGTGWLDLGGELTGRLPWGSAVLGAVALVVVVALPNGVLAVAALRRDARTGPLSVLVGVLLVGWILVEVAFIREVSFLQPFYAAVGLLQVWLGTRLQPEAGVR